MRKKHYDRYLPAFPQSGKQPGQQGIDTTVNGKIAKTSGPLCIFTLAYFVCLKKEITDNMGCKQLEKYEYVHCSLCFFMIVSKRSENLTSRDSFADVSVLLTFC